MAAIPGAVSATAPLPGSSPAVPSSRRPGVNRSTRTAAWRYLALTVIGLVSVLPLVWELATSLKSRGEDVYGQGLSLIPQHPTFENYHRVADVVPLLSFARNSLFVAALVVLGNIVGATVAGFALAKLPFRGRTVVVGLFLATLVLPVEAAIVSQYQIIVNLGLSNSLMGVALPGLIGPINVLLMSNAFNAIPKELDLAAISDGANAWQRFRYIGLPSVTGTLAIVVILTFIGAWDDFLWPLLVLQEPDRLTLTVGLAYLHGQFSSDPRLVAAGAMIVLIPILALFSVVQRYFFRGVGEGAVKG